jgi:hypothetical protein
VEDLDADAVDLVPGLGVFDFEGVEGQAEAGHLVGCKGLIADVVGYAVPGCVYFWSVTDVFCYFGDWCDVVPD